MTKSGLLATKVAVAFVITAVLLYGLNYLITPALVGERLELSFRPHFSLNFDSETWKATGPKSWKPGAPKYGLRYEMVDNLITSGHLFGIGEDRLVDLLGTADVVDNKGGEKRFFYVLGDQATYPAKSILFPGLFANLDRWMLEIRVRNGKTHTAKIFFT